MKTVDSITFAVRKTQERIGDRSFAVLKVHNVGEDDISELELTEYELDKLIKLAQKTKRVVEKRNK